MVTTAAEWRAPDLGTLDHTDDDWEVATMILHLWLAPVRNAIWVAARFGHR